MRHIIKLVLLSFSATVILTSEILAGAITIPLNVPNAELDYEWAVGCSNKGPEVGFKGQGVLALGKQAVYVRMRNNVKNTQLLEVTGEAAFLVTPNDDDGREEFVYNKQPSSPDGGAGGNPHIYLFGPNKTENSLTTQGVYYMGRCIEQSSGRYKDKAKVFSDLSFELLASDCGKSKTGLTLNSSRPSSSVDGELYFDNNQIYGGNTTGSGVKIGVGFVGPKLSTVKNSHAGAGGNPLVSYELLECSGVPSSVDPSWKPGVNDSQIATARKRDLFNCRAYKDGAVGAKSIGGVPVNLDGAYKNDITGGNYDGSVYCPRTKTWTAAGTCKVAYRSVDGDGIAVYTDLNSSNKDTVKLTLSGPSEEKRCNKWTSSP